MGTKWTKDYLKKYKRIWRQKQDDEYKARRSKYYKEWYKKNGRKRTKKDVDIIMLWRKKHPRKIRAHTLLNQALKYGIISQPERCYGCKKSSGRAFAHHENYNKPLKVIWLCGSCHKKIHIKKKG